MKNKLLYFIIIILLASCNKEDNNLFEQSADERSAAAIAALKSKLTAPSNGWRLKYKPTSETGSFYVLLHFDENNRVNIKTDLGLNGGEFYEQSVPFRVDSSLGLELIFETYSFFSYLFEQEGATFGAEFEFLYVNETPEGALVFSSKSDRTNPTIIVFEQATANDANLLGVDLSNNLMTLADDLSKFSSSLKVSYDNKDLAIYLSLDALRRTINFNYIGLSSAVLTGQTLNFSTGYVISGNSIVLEEPLTAIFMGNQIAIDQINLSPNLTEAQIDACATPLSIHTMKGTIPSSNDAITFETTLFDPNGAAIFERSDYFIGPLVYVLKDNKRLGQEIVQDIPGASGIHFIHEIQLANGDNLSGIGFAINHSDNTTTFALKEYTKILVDNKIKFEFSEDFRLFGNTEAEINYDNINKYFDMLTEGDNTYIFRYNEDIFELYNPCNKFNIVFFALD